MVVVVAVVAVVVTMADGRGGCGWCWVFFFGWWDILFYCDVYIILLC